LLVKSPKVTSVLQNPIIAAQLSCHSKVTQGDCAGVLNSYPVFSSYTAAQLV